MDKKRFVKNTLGWGIALWLIGYILSFILFFIVPLSLIGWVIAPIGTSFTLWVLITKIKSQDFKHYFWLSLVWTLIAIILDYFLVVKTLHPVDGYYKAAVYMYYVVTFFLPIGVGWWKQLKT